MKNYFKGYYFKHTMNDKACAFIVSEHHSKTESYASIQFINENGSHIKRFPLEWYHETISPLSIRIANNIFSETGIIANITFDDLQLECNFFYDKFTPLQSHIMGPFRFIPFMQCHHDVYSLTHHFLGTLILNDDVYNIEEGLCYIEGDKGASFPKKYLWTQANFEEEETQNSIMCALATIPMLGFQFMGCIAEIYYNHEHFRFATYKNVRIKQLSQTQVLLKQGKYYLKITQLTNNAHELDAPTSGLMTHKIKESPACLVRYEFYKKDVCIFEKELPTASFEAKNL